MIYWNFQIAHPSAAGQMKPDGDGVRQFVPNPDSGTMPAIVREWLTGDDLTRITLNQNRGNDIGDTIKAASKMAELAAQRIQEAGGKWECSHIWVKSAEQTAAMIHDEMFMTMRRLKGDGE